MNTGRQTNRKAGCIHIRNPSGEIQSKSQKEGILPANQYFDYGSAALTNRAQ
jgi:hypothetical protein